MSTTSPWDEQAGSEDDVEAKEGGERLMALGVLRLFHQAETATLALRHAKEQEAVDLRRLHISLDPHPLTETTLTNRAHSLQSRRARLRRLKSVCVASIQW